MAAQTRRKHSILVHPLLQFFIMAEFMFCASAQTGFISIDCGATGTWNDSRNIQWQTDEGFVVGGDARSVAVANNASSSSSKVLQTLREFPNSKMNKNCYVLPTTLGYRYLIRASFLYGNYDGRNSPPSFSLFLDATNMSYVSTSSTESVIKSYVLDSKGHNISVCLARSDSGGVPFISALELRTLSNTMYPLNGNDKVDYSAVINMQILFQINYGASQILRYPDDQYDRIWEPLVDSAYQTETVESSVNGPDQFANSVPDKVLLTAISSANNTTPMTLLFTSQAQSNKIYMIAYFNDIRNRSTTDYCVFTVLKNGLYGATAAVNTASYSGLWGYQSYSTGIFNLTLAPLLNSTLGPIINAVEIMLQTSVDNGTDSQDAAALNEIRDHFNLNEYAGDPCLPTGYNWDWITCNSNSPPRVITLDLSRRGLNGTVPAVIASLTALQSLNMANNNLSGTVPRAITQSNIETNFTGNAYLCVNESCGAAPQSGNKSTKKSKNTTIIASVVCAAVVLVAAITITLIVIRRNRKRYAAQQQLAGGTVRTNWVIINTRSPGQAQAGMTEATLKQTR